MPRGLPRGSLRGFRADHFCVSFLCRFVRGFDLGLPIHSQRRSETLGLCKAVVGEVGFAFFECYPVCIYKQGCSLSARYSCGISRRAFWIGGVSSQNASCSQAMLFFLVQRRDFHSAYCKFLQLGLFGLVAFAGVQAVSENPSSRARVVVLWGLCLLASVGAIAASMGAVLPIAGEYGHMNPRSLSGLAMYWAGVYAMAWAVCSRDARRCVAGIGVVLVFIYAVTTVRL